jgi:hypothetical protein
MTNAVTNRGAAIALPEFKALPAFSAALNHAVFLTRSGGGVAGEARDEARRLLADYAPLLSAARPERIRAWLERVNFGMSNPIVPADFALRAPVIIDAVQSYPAAMFTLETARVAVLSLKWFPGGAELAEFLAPRLRALEDFELTLQRVLSAPEPAPPRPEPTEAEKQAVEEAVRAFTGRASHIQPPIRTIAEQLEELSR